MYLDTVLGFGIFRWLRGWSIWHYTCLRSNSSSDLTFNSWNIQEFCNLEYANLPPFQLTNLPILISLTSGFHFLAPPYSHCLQKVQSFQGADSSMPCTTFSFHLAIKKINLGCVEFSITYIGKKVNIVPFRKKIELNCSLCINSYIHFYKVNRGHKIYQGTKTALKISILCNIYNASV